MAVALSQRHVQRRATGRPSAAPLHLPVHVFVPDGWRLAHASWQLRAVGCHPRVDQLQRILGRRHHALTRSSSRACGSKENTTSAPFVREGRFTRSRT